MTENWNPRSFRAETVPQLLDTQLRAVRLILRRFADVVVQCLERGTDRDDDEAAARSSPNTLHLLRPHQVYCIDGGRGSGKTYTLASVQHAINQLQKCAEGTAEVSWSAFLRYEVLGAALDERLFSRIGKPGTPFVAQVFRILFPSDQEKTESLMAAIFSEMETRLFSYKPESDARTKEWLSLVTLLREIELGFNAARGRPFYPQGLLIDSRNALDKLSHEKKAAGLELGATDTHEFEYNQIAYNRVVKWREAVRDYLTFFNATVLVILVDDSDVQPELTQDILSSLRNYLTHPRIVTILAGNVRAMRSALAS